MSVEKNLPEIRFKGFSGDWEEYPLSTFISSLDAGVSVNSGDRPANESEFGILKTSCVTNGFFESNENKVVFKAEEINRLKEPVLENTIIISRMNTPALVGANAYVSQGVANYFLPDRLWAAKPTSIGDLKFIAYILGSDKGRLALSDLATGTSGSMKNISKPSVLRLTFRAPRDQEQTQIGNYFQKLDNLINQHQQKHDKLSSVKKAMLEKMFPKQGETVPEIRFNGFSGEWEQSNLEKCTDLLTGNPFNSKEFSSEGIFLVRGMNVKRGYLDSSPEISEFWPSSKGLERYLLEPEDIVVQMDGALIGKSYAKIKSDNLPAILVQRVTRIRCSQLNPEFIYQYIQKDFLSHISGIKTETAVPHLSLHDIRAFSIFLPERPEQNAIGNYFQKLDTLINQHQQQITKLKNIKQACLNKMFV